MFFSKSTDDAATPDAVPPCPTPAEIKDVLKEVYDPEIGVNIVDLGLIYDVAVAEGGKVKIQMTLTTPGCPYGPQLLQEVNYITRNTKGVTEVDVEVVWDPPWSMDMVSEAVRLDMGLDW
jgi:metal-sulfur cluster biosynthetic enzyme